MANHTRAAVTVLATLLLSSVASTQPADLPLARFVGTWVGTQGWAIVDPPPGARNDQPVALTIELVDGRLTGTMRPFLGGEDGVVLVDATVVGNELHAKAVVARPGTQTADGAPVGRRGGGPPGWKDAVAVTFVFSARGDAVSLAGTADVRLGDASWMKLRYDLAKRRPRYGPA